MGQDSGGHHDEERFLETTDLEADLEERAARGGLAQSVGQVARGLAEVVALVLLARLLTPQDFGLVGMVTALAGVLAMFKDLGLSHYVIQCQGLRQAEANGLFLDEPAAEHRALRGGLGLRTARSLVLR